MSFFKVLIRSPYTFQKIVVITSIIVLIILLILLSTSFYSLNKSRNFPPHISQCPDYFETVGVNKCSNIQNLGNGTCKDKIFDFNQPQYSSMKDKYQKAIECGWEWDGITNSSKFEEV